MRRIVSLMACLALSALLLACDSDNHIQPSQSGAVARTPGPEWTLGAKRVPLNAFPLAITAVRNAIWVTAAPKGKLLHLVEGEVVDSFEVGMSRVGVSVGGDVAWVTGGGDGAVPDGSALMLDTGSGHVIDRLDFPGESPYGVNPSGERTFIALFQGDLIALHSRRAGHSRIPLRYGLTHVLASHGAAWVSQPQGGNVWRVTINASDDTSASATELHEEVPRSCPQGLDRTREHIWVADACAGWAWLLDPADGKIVDTIEGIGRRPTDVAIAGDLAWIVSSRTNLVSVVDVRSREILAQEKAGEGASAIAATRDGAWVVNSEDYSITHFTLQRSTTP